MVMQTLIESECGNGMRMMCGELSLSKNWTIITGEAKISVDQIAKRDY